MRKLIIWFAAVLVTVFCPFAIDAQVDDFCREFGYIATLEGPRLTAPFVYGRINVKGQAAGARPPRIAITYTARGQSPSRLAVPRSGNYCFKITGGGGGTLVLDIDGVEAARRSLDSFSAAQQREDFEVSLDPAGRTAAPSVISTKFQRPPNEKTSELYKLAAAAEQAKDHKAAIVHLTAIVAADPDDFIAWGLIGSHHLEQGKLEDSEKALRKALELRVDYTPAWVNVGRVRMGQKQYPSAIEILKHAAELEPEAARTYQLLGEAYLLAKVGSLGVEALNKAIELDPIGMADAHLQLAHLYQLAKANKMAADEYKKFLAKVPDHPDKKKFEKFIRENEQK